MSPFAPCPFRLAPTLATCGLRQRAPEGHQKPQGRRRQQAQPRQTARTSVARRPVAAGRERQQRSGAIDECRAPEPRAMTWAFGRPRGRQGRRDHYHRGTSRAKSGRRASRRLLPVRPESPPGPAPTARPQGTRERPSRRQSARRRRPTSPPSILASAPRVTAIAPATAVAKVWQPPPMRRMPPSHRRPPRGRTPPEVGARAAPAIPRRSRSRVQRRGQRASRPVPRRLGSHRHGMARQEYPGVSDRP